MPCVDTLPGTLVDTLSLERVRYFPRQLLTADDLRIEQEYFREKQRRHNRYLHGWGVVCGLEVRADPDAGPLAVRICPGYALGPQGDEIYVPSPVPLDLYGCLRRPADPCPPTVTPASASTVVLVVQIRYAECPTRPVRTLPAGCSCDETACEFSRLRDGFEVRCAPKPESTPEPGHGQPTICQVEKDKGRLLPVCLLPASDCWLDLATVVVKKPATGAEGPLAIDDTMIDNGTRRIVYSGAMVQDQVIRCCCKG